MGPTHVHRLVPLALAAAGLLVSGCGTERPEAATAADASFSPAPTGTTSTASPAATGALEGFPLDVGYDEENGDDHYPVRVTGRPATTAFDLCGLPAWDPRASTTDVLGVEFRGEAEWARGRTLVRYPTEHDATVAVTAVADALTGCSDESGEPGYGTAHTVLQALGEQSVAWTDTYWFESDGDRRFGTGLTVYHLVRVGQAVLLAYEYGEGNGSEESRANSIERATELENPVVSRMDLVG